MTTLPLKFTHEPATQVSEYEAAVAAPYLRNAIAFLRDRRFGRAEYELARGLQAIARAEGDDETVAEVEQLRYFKVGDGPHLASAPGGEAS